MPDEGESLDCDKVGNVLTIDNPIPFPPGDNTQGGPLTETFSYDALDRLVSARGMYRYADKTRNYIYGLSYDGIGNLKSKVQSDTIFPSKKPGQVQSKTSYSLSPIVYGGPGPHQVTQIGTRAYTYDPDGNVTGWTDSKNGQNRSMTWTADGRMATIADQGNTTNETYDESGRLAIERGSQGEKAFVNQWYTVINGSNFWKDVWAGADRIATKRVETLGKPEDKRYFLHKDLQGDTNMVTDPAGVPYEHLLYFPGGEIWVLESSTTFREPYTWTGAYFDDIKSVLSLGQRWYEPREEYFFSLDPALSVTPDQVVEDPALLPPYNYAENNPLRLVDRDGRAPESAQQAFRAAFGRPGGGFDFAALNAFNAQLLKRFNAPGSQKLGGAIGRFAAQPGKSIRAGLAALDEAFAAKPLVDIRFTRTNDGLQLSKIKISPTFGFKAFTVKKKK